MAFFARDAFICTCKKEECDMCNKKYFEPKTNAGLIRSMTDEELAELLRDYQCNTCDFSGFCEETDKCKEEILKWLKQENETN